MNIFQEKFLENLQNNIKKRITLLEKIKEKDIILILGSTGCGKSTFINYLFNCKLIELPMNYQGKKLIQVSPDSYTKSVTKIGTSNKSTTLYPEILENKENNMIIIDFPGFEDNRGNELNISNALILKKLFNLVKSVKIFLLIEFESFSARRGQGADRGMETLTSLFNGEKELEMLRNSFNILITKSPNIPINEFIEHLKDNWKFGKYSDRILFYHPLDEERELYKKKKDIFFRLENMKPIYFPKNVFKIYLSPEDKIKMIKIGKYLEDKLQAYLNTRNFEKIAFYFEKIKMLKNLEESFFLVIYQTLENSIMECFYTQKKRIRENIYLKLFDESKNRLTELKIGLNFFKNTKFRNKIDLDELENFFYCQKKQFEQEKKIIKNLKDQKEISKKKFENQNKIIEMIKKENKKEKIKHEKRLEQLLSKIDKIQLKTVVNEIRNKDLIKEYNLLKITSITNARARKILEERQRKKNERGYIKSFYEGTKNFFKSLF